ncbi:MAG: hypothetical protein HY233_11995 [Acidobacteriales bacterium]|nr:hypothetical protein [Terriglobales bacterium]
MNSDTDSNEPRLLSLVVNRIYHEDMLLAQRTYSFLMMQAVLAAALTFSSSGGSTRKVAWIIAAFGLILAWLQAAFGRRSHATIGFWRTYLHKIERDGTIKFDSLQTQFFSEGKADLPDRSCIKYLGTKPIFQTLPWKPKLIPGANVLVGLIIPWLVVVFWLFFILLLVFDTVPSTSICELALFGRALTVRTLAVSAVALVSFVIVWKGVQPWPPAGSELQAKPNPQ